jgi:hypothetical protein
VYLSHNLNLPRIPICPVPQPDECMSSWIERTACFYGCDLNGWIGQFSDELTPAEYGFDLDSSDQVRALMSAWNAIPLENLPLPSDASRLLPKNGRLAFCEQCWNEDVRGNRQPYVRRYWLHWTTVHCVNHREFLSAKNRSVDRGAPNISWQDVWTSRANWRNALHLEPRGFVAGTLWYKMPARFSPCTERLMRSLERLADPYDAHAREVLDGVCATWRSCVPLNEQAHIPVLLENRLEVLSQAAAVLVADVSQ